MRRYGTNTTLVKESLTDSGLQAAVLCGLRFGLAGAMLLPLLVLPGIRRVPWQLAIELGFLLFVGFQCQARTSLARRQMGGALWRLQAFLGRR